MGQMAEPGAKPAKGGGDNYKEFWLPEEAVAELPPDVKPGDVIEYIITGKDKDGQIAVKYHTGKEKGDDMDHEMEGMGDDLENAMPEHMGGKIKPAMGGGGY